MDGLTDQRVVSAYSPSGIWPPLIYEVWLRGDEHEGLQNLSPTSPRITSRIASIEKDSLPKSWLCAPYVFWQRQVPQRGSWVYCFLSQKFAPSGNDPGNAKFTFMLFWQ